MTKGCPSASQDRWGAHRRCDRGHPVLHLAAHLRTRWRARALRHPDAGPGNRLYRPEAL